LQRETLKRAEGDNSGGGVSTGGENLLREIEGKDAEPKPGKVTILGNRWERRQRNLKKRKPHKTSSAGEGKKNLLSGRLWKGRGGETQKNPNKRTPGGQPVGTAKSCKAREVPEGPRGKCVQEVDESETYWGYFGNLKSKKEEETTGNVQKEKERKKRGISPSSAPLVASVTPEEK